MDKELILELLKGALVELFPQEHMFILAVAAAELAVLTVQVLVIVTQAAAIVSELSCPQYIRKFRREKAANIVLSACLVIVAVLILAGMCRIVA